MKDTTEVATRDDGPYENVFLSVGNAADRTTKTKSRKLRKLENTELETLYSDDGFAKRIVDLPAEEMMRAGFEIEGIDDDGNVRSALEAINTVPLITDALRWSSLYGGALVVMLINDGGALEQPLNEDSIKALEQLRVYDRWQISRHAKYTDPADSRYGMTEIYLISPILGSPYHVHESRCIAIDGLPTPDRVRQDNDEWGASKLQHCYTQLERFGMSHVWANALLERAQQAIHGIPELTNLLRTPGGEALVRKRVDLVDMTRSINNTIVIDAEENYDIKATSLAGVADIIDRLGLALSAVTGIPESLLFGRQQGGLNSTGKADLENWYAKIGQDQINILLPILDRLCCLQMKAMKKYKEDYLIKFLPLSVPSRKDMVESDFKRAQTFEILNDIGALDASEIRKMLPDEGYDIEDVEKMPETGGEVEGMETEPTAPDEPTKPTELGAAQVDLLRAQAEKLRMKPDAVKQDAAPIPQPAPIINVNLGGVKLDVNKDAIVVNNMLPDAPIQQQAQAPNIQVDVHVPQSKTDVTVTNVLPDLTVNAILPARKTETTMTHDKDGNIIAATQIEINIEKDK